jgi:RimJ/RimL family protein N-acetyltransferase
MTREKFNPVEPITAEKIQIVDLDAYDPTDAEILSWSEMMKAPDQLRWDYDESWAKQPTTPQGEIAGFHQWRDARRGTNYPLWAIAGKRVVGMIGVNRCEDPARRHCGELGFGVAEDYTRRGIGRQLLTAAIAKARQIGLTRLEADCFADNAAAIALLRKCGFAEEGLRIGAICKDGKLRDQRLFGLVL